MIEMDINNTIKIECQSLNLLILLSISEQFETKSRKVLIHIQLTFGLNNI